jgi:P63C domain
MENTPESTAITRGSKGGEARAMSLSTDRRKAIAKLAAESRWGSDLPQATHDGPLQIGDTVLAAAVLPNGKRLLSQGTFLQALGRSRTPKAGTGGLTTVDGLPFFLSAEVLKPFITDELRLSTTPIFFRFKSGRRAVGYDALLLPMVCHVYQRLHASITERLAGGDEADVAQAKRVYAQYRHIIDACNRLDSGFAKRGILALVDDATGYRGDQLKEDVLRVISAYMSPTLVKWAPKFPPQFFEEIYRLHGWEYKPGSTRNPQYTGTFITRYVYEPLPPGVLEEMKIRLPKNESGNRRAKLWQTLSADTGIPHLDRQINDIITIMRLSEGKDEFIYNFERLFGKQLQLRLKVLQSVPELTT